VRFFFSLVLLLCLCVSFVMPVWSAPLKLGSDLPYETYEDIAGDLTRDTVLPLLQAEADTYTSVTVSRGYTRSVYWFSFELPASAFTSGERWMEMHPTFLDDVQIFYRPLNQAGAWQLWQSGDTHPGPAGNLDYRFPLFKVPASEAGYEFLLRVSSSSALMLQLTFWEPNEFTPQAIRATNKWSIYFGVALLSSLIALSLAITLRSRLLWSVTAMSATYGLVACVQGYIAWLLPARGLLIQHYLTGVFTLLSYAAVIWLTAEALALRKRMPRIYRAMLASSGAIALLVFSVPLGFYGEAFRCMIVLYLLVGFFSLGLGLYLWWHDRPSSVPLLVGASPLFCILISLAGVGTVLGFLEYRKEIYVLWQAALLENMLLVPWLAIIQVRKRRQQALEKAGLAHDLRVEREARFHQRQFMGMVAHEFRTPLAVITASLENMRLADTSAELQSRRHRRIERATERLVQLTDNCLADSRLDAQSLIIAPEPTRLAELLSSAASLVHLSDHHHWVLTFEGEEVTDLSDIEAVANVDPALMRIALSNVIDNAVKYSPKGAIVVELRREDSAWLVSIADSGNGIAAALTPHIFERYRQASQSGQNAGGVGLGLFVARQIAQAHGGSLKLADNSNAGCRFVFIFPDLWGREL